MASVSLDSFLPEVLPECAGVPYPVAINAIRNACFDFCKESNYWNVFQSATAYSANTATYTLTAPTDTQIVSVLGITLDDKQTIAPTSLEDIPLLRPAWATATGNIETYVQPEPKVITFVAVPDVSGTFVPSVAYAPSRTATTVDDRIFNLHLETIKHGALWKLKAMSGQPWTDPAGASVHEKQFWIGTGAATIERNRGNSRALMRVAPRSFL